MASPWEAATTCGCAILEGLTPLDTATGRVVAVAVRGLTMVYGETGTRAGDGRIPCEVRDVPQRAHVG